MLERTQTALNLLDVMQELELLDVSFLNDGEWIKSTDRKTLYRAAITALVENAQSEGFKVTIHCESDAGDPVMYVDVENATPETADEGLIEQTHYERGFNAGRLYFETEIVRPHSGYIYDTTEDQAFELGFSHGSEAAQREHERANDPEYEREYCEACEGSGCTEDGENMCPACEGFGSIILDDEYRSICESERRMGSM